MIKVGGVDGGHHAVPRRHKNFVHRCFLCSSFDDGGAEPVHQDQPSAGLGAAVCGRCHGNYLSTSHHYGHAQPVCVVQAAAEGQRA